MEICKYCQKNKAIENSHIIPSFMYKWLKDTCSSGYIRTTDEPNKRKQDGFKSPLLCRECEVSFSKIEDEFKKSIFIKLANYRAPCPPKLLISESVKKFIYILAWRTLADIYHYCKEHSFTDEEFGKFPEFLNDIKAFIENGSKTKFKAHLIPCTRDILERLHLPKADGFYYERTICADPRIWDDWERFIIFIKIPFGLIAVELVSNQNDTWVGTQIDNIEYLLLSEIRVVPGCISEYIDFYYDEFKKSRKQITEKQKHKMKSIVKNVDPNSGSFKSMTKER